MNEPSYQSTRTLGLLLVLVWATLMNSDLNAGTFVYVGCAEESEVLVWQLDRAAGDLTPVQRVTIPGVTEPGTSTPLAVSPDRRILYAATRGTPKSAAGFAIDPATGKLKFIAAGPLSDSMACIATDRTGRYLLAASYPGHKITVSPIGPPGTVQPTQQVLTNHPNAHAIVLTPDNRHALAPTLGNDRVNQFAFDAATGRLEPVDPASVSVQAGAGPRHLAFHPNGRLVYVIGELDGAIHVFDFAPGRGQLKEKQLISVLPPGFEGKPSSADLHLTPDGRYLYGSERTSSTLAGFKVDPADGTLSRIESVSTEKQPRSFAIDSSGRYLLAAGQLSHAVSSYGIDSATGRLIKLKDYPMGRNPNWIEIVDLP